MTIITESENPLVTPSFIGTDDEKIAVLGYWSSCISQLRNLNKFVVSHENKLAIIEQLKRELELLELEVNNATSQPVARPDGSTDLNMADAAASNEPELVVDLGTPEEVSAEQPTLAQRLARLDPPKLSVAEAMARRAGIWDTSRKKKK